jgi:hypothetical protein
MVIDSILQANSCLDFFALLWYSVAVHNALYLYAVPGIGHYK